MISRAVALAAIVATVGCGTDGADEDAVPVDSTFVDALVDLQLADARAALASDSLDPDRVADSLRRLALDLHGLDSVTLTRRLDALAETPAVARATYDAVDAQLARERRSGLPY